MHQLFFFLLLFGLFRCLEFVEKPRKKIKARESSRDHLFPFFEHFPHPSFSLCLRWVKVFILSCFLGEDSKYRISALGFVSASAAAACEPCPVAGVEGWVEAEAGRHDGQA